MKRLRILAITISFVVLATMLVGCAGERLVTKTVHFTETKTIAQATTTKTTTVTQTVIKDFNGSRIYQTLWHPDRYLAVPWFEIRGNKIYRTPWHPDGHSIQPIFEIRFTLGIIAKPPCFQHANNHW